MNPTLKAYVREIFKIIRGELPKPIRAGLTFGALGRRAGRLLSTIKRHSGDPYKHIVKRQ